MKKLLEKPWAKALAFLLTLLPGMAASSWYTYMSITCIRTGAWICCGP